jgi:NAD-dependent dihydropyrimidine dehydrogenase PreA subunit
MVRKIIKIDEEKCNGCGLCIEACHEGALALIDGKARLVSESYCDGLGDCLPECPVGAITIEEREAEAYDEEAVKRLLEERKRIEKGQPGEHGCSIDKNKKKDGVNDTLACGCPGTRVKTITKSKGAAVYGQPPHVIESQLQQWPCQIKLVPVNAPFLANAHLLIAADCTAYAYANIHQEFMRNKITLIGCPKLDNIDYSEKLTKILRHNEIKSMTVLKMEVPCCNGLGHAAKKALMDSGKFIPWGIVTISTDGTIIEE